MYDPVLVIESGNTYERGNIEAWLQTNMLVASCPKSCFRRFCMRLIAKHAYTHRKCRTDPISGQQLASADLVPNVTLRTVIHRLRASLTAIEAVKSVNAALSIEPPPSAAN